ncbi:MAG TPA: hypothetical protein VNS09_21855 [Solirubrobacter sp.]|nr:hypothetical protein [Solirubrobacter sp.]
MSEPRARIYELALRSLDEQDRQVGDLRGRLAPVLAAGGVGLTLLARPVFAGEHPSGVLEIAATSIGLLGALVLVLAGAYVLHPRELAFSLNARATLDAIRGRDPELLEDDDLYCETMIATFTRRRDGNQPIVDRLHTSFSIALLGLLAELGGLALAAALAS